MKKSTIIFSGFTLAYCMSILLTMQIKNFDRTSVAVQKPAVPSSYTDRAEYSSDSTENHKKEMDANSYMKFSSPVITHLKNTRPSRERNMKICNSKNLDHNVLLYSSSIRSVMFYSSTHKTLSFIKSCKQRISFYYLNPLYMVIEAIPQSQSEKYSIEDSKSLGGFDTIVEFPDKLS
ncbi:hypothetical protein [Chryseobacterium vrystaatense]|nr:hypothetical protein [Chryseobacterium vrystaatense]